MNTPELDPAGLEAAAKALYLEARGASTHDWSYEISRRHWERDAKVAVAAYLSVQEQPDEREVDVPQSVVEQIAQAIYGASRGPRPPQLEWERLPSEPKTGYLTQARAVIDSVAGSFSYRERQVLADRHSSQPLSSDEIAARFHVPGHRIVQIERAALRKLLSMFGLLGTDPIAVRDTEQQEREARHTQSSESGGMMRKAKQAERWLHEHGLEALPEAVGSREITLTADELDELRSGRGCVSRDGVYVYFD